MKRHFIKNFTIYLAVLLIVGGFLLGSQIDNTSASNLKITDKPLSFEVLKMIFVKNNLLFFTILFLGTLTYSLLSYATLFANSILLGIYFFKIKRMFSLNAALVLFLPHGVIEFFWMAALTVFTLSLSKAFFRFLNTKYQDKTVQTLLTSRHTLYLIILLYIGILVEFFITPNIFKHYFIN